MIDKKKADAIYKFNTSLCFAEYVMHISKIIKGKFFEKAANGAIKTTSQAFKDCVFYKNQNGGDLRFGPQLLYYPCKPNSQEYDEFTGRIHQDNYKTHEYLAVRSSLLVADRVKDANPDVLLERLKPTVLSHSTMLDCIFANADLSSNKTEAKNCVTCLDAFLELYKNEPAFKEKLDEALLTQAMTQACPETRKHIIRTCPEFYGYLPAKVFTERPFELFKNQVFRVNNLEYKQIALESVSKEEKPALEAIIKAKDTEMQSSNGLSK